MPRPLTTEALAARWAPVAEAALPHDQARRLQRLDQAIDDDGTINPQSLRVRMPLQLLVWYVDGNASVGTDKGAEVRMPRAVVLEWIDARVKSAPTVGDLIVGVRIDGAPTALVSIAADTTSAGKSLEIGVGASSILTVDVTQIGSGNPGADLTVSLAYREQVVI